MTIALIAHDAKKELKLILKELDERCKTYKLEHPEVF